MKYAWIENNTVRDVCPGIPAECYHPDIAVYYDTQIPDDILPGATLVDGEWTNPVPVAPPTDTEKPVTVSPVEFKLLWTPQERVAIKVMRSTDPVIDDFYEILDDPRLTFVNLNLQSTQAAVDYLLSRLVTAEVVQAGAVVERRAEILSGAFR